MNVNRPMRLKRLRYLADSCVIQDWDEFTMRIPADPERDADLILSWAADEIEYLTQDVDNAIACIFRWGGIDGAHHKQWTLDQVLKILAGDRYGDLVRQAKNGEDGADTYNWDEGCPP